MNDECNCEDKGCGCGEHTHEQNEGCGCGGEHGHSHSEGCGCGHNHDAPTITIMMDNNEEVVCNVIGIFDALDREYIAIIPVDGEEDVLVYRYSENGEEVQLDNIETDEEYNVVAEAFYEFVSADEFIDEDEE